jgi:hypothetical protein
MNWSDTNLQSNDPMIDTDVFVVIENDFYDFVAIDEDASYDAVVIDIPQNDFVNAITVDFEPDSESDTFVSIDEDQIFVSDFTEEDLFPDFDLL